MNIQALDSLHAYKWPVTQVRSHPKPELVAADCTVPADVGPEPSAESMCLLISQVVIVCRRPVSVQLLREVADVFFGTPHVKQPADRSLQQWQS